jgi:hypothetical protein
MPLRMDSMGFASLYPSYVIAIWSDYRSANAFSTTNWAGSP